MSIGKSRDLDPPYIYHSPQRGSPMFYPVGGPKGPIPFLRRPATKIGTVYFCALIAAWAAASRAIGTRYGLQLT